MNKILEGNNKFIVIGVVLLIGIVAYIMPNKNNLAGDLMGNASLDGAIEIPQDNQAKNKERQALKINEDDFNVNVVGQKEEANNVQVSPNKQPKLAINESAFNESAFKEETINNQVAIKEENSTKKEANVTEKVGENKVSDEIFTFQNPLAIDKDKNNQSSSDEIVALKAENAQSKSMVSELKNEIAELIKEIAMLKNQKVVATSTELREKVVEEPKLSAEEIKKQEELKKQQMADLEKLSKEINFYKPELKIINGKLEFESVMYGVGDTFLARYKIEKITSNSVRFSRNGQFYNLRF